MATYTSFFRAIIDRPAVGAVGKYDSTQPHNGIKSIINLFEGIVNGSISGQGLASLDSDSGVFATGTVTAAGVQNADTVTINGTALTATQQNARGTVTLASALAADTVTVNGTVFTAVSGTPVGNQFDISGTDTQDAASLVTAINAATALTGTVTAANAAGIVTIRAATAGTGGNALTLASSNNTRLAVSGATLSGGAAIANNQFDFGGTDTQTAASIVAAITASSTALISGSVTAANVAGVVTITSASIGATGNMVTLASSNNTRLAVSGARLTGGVSVVFQTYKIG